MGISKTKEALYRYKTKLNNQQAHHALSTISKKQIKSAVEDNIREQFKTLQANLSAYDSKHPLKTLLFVGASNAIGTSTTAAQFAQILVENAKYGILLIDANYKNPKLHQFFKINHHNGSLGLSHQGVKLNLCKIEPSKLYVLPYNERLAGPESIFQSPWFKLMYEKFDYIILDGPSTRDIPDIQKLSNKVDGVILVLEAGKTRRQVAIRAKRQLHNTGANLLGVVLNKRKYYIPEFIYKHLYN